MSLKFILLWYFVVWVYNYTLFIPTDQILLIISPTHCLNSIFMHWCSFLIFVIRRIPNYYFTRRRSCYDSLPSLHPLYCKQWILLLVFLLSQVFWASTFPIFFVCCISWEYILSIRMMRKDRRSVLLIEIIFFIVRIICLSCCKVELSILSRLALIHNLLIDCIHSIKLISAHVLSI